MLLGERISQQPSLQLENEEVARIISDLTEKLSPMQKTIFILSDLEEMTNDEVSEIAGISKSSVKSNLYFARKKISELIEKYL